MSESLPPLILVVDDNENNIQVLGSLLRTKSYRVAVATDGLQAIDYLKQARPDLILLDVMMPGMDGIEVCRRLKKKESYSAIPILFLTSLTDTENKIRAFEAGGDDYLTKPFSQAEVLARVRVFLERSQNQAELMRSREELKKANLTLERKVKKRTDRIKKMQSHLMVQEKMASIGLLAAGVAHELNNPINFVYTNFITLEENVDDIRGLLSDYRVFLEAAELNRGDREKLEKLKTREEEIRLDFVLEDLDSLFMESKDGFERISYIVRSMRNFSRTDQEDDFSPADINKIVEDTLVIARNEYKHHCTVATDLGDIKAVMCVSQQISEVLLNLVVNAAHALQDMGDDCKGEIRVRTYQSGNWVCCEVADNGPGIADKNRSRIFEPFFTTKEIGRGTGLGLSISYDIIVEKHKGTLEIAKSGKSGTTFRLCLPETAE